MSEVPETDTGAAFAAGHATATAEQAAEDAATAEVRADIAQAEAEQAAERAAGAETAAWDARAAVDELRGEFAAFASELRESLKGGSGNGDAARQPEAGTAVPAPEPKADAPAGSSAEPAADDDKPKKRRYGSRLWFGDE